MTTPTKTKHRGPGRPRVAESPELTRRNNRWYIEVLMGATPAAVAADWGFHPRTVRDAVRRLARERLAAGLPLAPCPASD